MMESYADNALNSRRWANRVLQQYVIQGYAVNEKRIEALQRTVEIQTKMLASALDVEESDVLTVPGVPWQE